MVYRELKMNYKEHNIICRIVKAVQEATKQQSENMEVRHDESSDYIELTFTLNKGLNINTKITKLEQEGNK